MPSQTSAQEDSAVGVTPCAPWRVAAVTVLPGHRLTVTFQDSRISTLDCSRVRQPGAHGVFAPLADEHFFAQVQSIWARSLGPMGPILILAGFMRS